LHWFSSFFIGATDDFWTASQEEGDSTADYFVQIKVATTRIVAGKLNNILRIWCLRGGSATSNPPY
jgi:hypothetical protein